MGVITGKFNKVRWIPLYAAKIIIAQFPEVTSRSRFHKWWDKETPRHIPKYPNRTYPEWKGWNDFLQNDNSFEKELSRKRKITRPYWEAVRWVQAQRYSTADEYAEKYNDEVPKDIPKQPHVFYKTQWQGWGTFLGKNIRSRIMSKSENLGILTLCRMGENAPGNMFEVVTDDDGMSTLQQKLAARPDLQPFKAYHYSNEDKQIAADLLTRYASHQHGNVYLTANMNDIVFQFDTALLIYKPPT